MGNRAGVRSRKHAADEASALLYRLFASGGALLQPHEVLGRGLLRGREGRIVLRGHSRIGPFSDFGMAIGKGDSTGAIVVRGWNIHPLVDGTVERIANKEPIVDRTWTFINEHPGF